MNMEKSTKKERPYIDGLIRSDQMIINKAYTEEPLINMSEDEQRQWERDTIIECTKSYKLCYVQSLNTTVSSGIEQLTNMCAVTALTAISEKAIFCSNRTISGIVSIKPTKMLDCFRDRILFMKHVIMCKHVDVLKHMFVHADSINVDTELPVDKYEVLESKSKHVSYIQERVSNAIAELAMMDEFINLKKIAIDAIKSAMIAECITEDIAVSEIFKWKYFILQLNNPQCHRLMTKEVLSQYPVLDKDNSGNIATMSEIKRIWTEMRPNRNFNSYWTTVCKEFDGLTEAVMNGEITIVRGPGTDVRIQMDNGNHWSNTLLHWKKLDGEIESSSTYPRDEFTGRDSVR